MTDDVDTAPLSVVRRLDTPDARALADLAAIFEDLQTVLRSCERLVSELAASDPDKLALEAFWTTAVLSYARCFSIRPTGVGLTADDVTATGLNGDVLGWHEVMRQLREHYVDQASWGGFSVGVSQNAAGKATGIAVASAPPVRVDDVTVRQTGAICYALSGIVDSRIGARQEAVFAALNPLGAGELDELPLMEVATD